MPDALGRFFKYLRLVALVLFLVVIAINFDRLHVYQAYLLEKSPEISMRYEQLSADMDEAAVRRHFSDVPLRCMGNEQDVATLGDKVCYASVDKVDGNAALTLAVFFKQGRISLATVHVPLWQHVGMKMRLRARYGLARSGGVTAQGGRILRWELPNGYIDYTRDRTLNPLQWSAVVWVPRVTALRAG